MIDSYGDATVELLNDVLARGADRALVRADARQAGHRPVLALMRHSAREYVPGRHDLENPLTAEGRELARRLGGRLPKQLTLRAYASPPARCMETAALALEGHRQAGGAVTRHRPLEALGVFYALDQMKMWKGMDAAGGLVPYVHGWVEGRVPADAMMPADLAARLLLKVLADKLTAPAAEPRLDLCVSHDMTLYLMRAVLLDEPVDGPGVRYLDALVLFEAEGELWMASQHGAPRSVSGWLRTD